MMLEIVLFAVYSVNHFFWLMYFVLNYSAIVVYLLDLVYNGHPHQSMQSKITEEDHQRGMWDA